MRARSKFVISVLLAVAAFVGWRVYNEAHKEKSNEKT